MSFCLLVSVACSGTNDNGDDTIVVPPRDAGIIRDAGPIAPSVEVGGGQDMFIALSDGDDVELVAGPQGGGRLGGHHIWFGVRMFGLDRDELKLLTFTITSTDGENRAVIQRNPALAPIQADPATGGLQLIALPPIIDDCCKIASKDAFMVATVETNTETYEDRVRVHVSQCPGPSEGGASLCP